MKADYLKPFLLAAFIILIDQIIKTWVRTHMDFNQELHFLGSKGMLRYTENNGMAFGWEIGGEAGKLILTVFRIIAVGGIGYGLVYLIKHNYHRGLITCVALILYQHGQLFEGRVVDMFYFPLFRGTYPDWFPVLHGQSFEFFEPIFNLADAAISVGVITILLYQKRYFKHEIPMMIGNTNSEIVEE